MSYSLDDSDDDLDVYSGTEATAPRYGHTNPYGASRQDASYGSRRYDNASEQSQNPAAYNARAADPAPYSDSVDMLGYRCADSRVRAVV
jgi:hypothetical protein